MLIDKTKLTKEQAEAYLNEIENRELDRNELDKVAGGAGSSFWHECPQDRCLSVLI